MRHTEFRIELNGTFEPLDRLAQTFGRASRRVVTSGSVKLARLFILARLRVRRRHQNLRRDWRDALFAPAFFRSRGHLRRAAIQRGMAQVAQDSFERRLAAQRIELRLNSQPYYPAVADRVRVEHQLQRSLAFAKMQVNQRQLIWRDVTVN